MVTYNYGQFLDRHVCFTLQNTIMCSLHGENEIHREYSIFSVCYLPVCVELVCMVEEVEFGDVTGGSRLNRFLLDKQQMFSGVFLVRTFLNRLIFHIKYSIHL